MGVLAWAAADTGTPVSSGPAADISALQKRIDQWLDGYNKADVKQMMDVFGEDLTLDAEGAPTTMDKTESAQIYSGVFAKYQTHIDGVTDELRASGDLAFDRGHYTITLTPKAGGPSLTRKGHFLEVWERQDGVWKVQHLVDFADTPQ